MNTLLQANHLLCLRLNYQILHSARIEFGNIEGKLSYLSGRVFEGKIPDKISNILCKLRSEL